VISVEIFSDIVCPWCYIGSRRFATAVDALRADPSFPAIESVYRPFQLDPSAPRSPGEPVADVYARKFGGPERAAQMIASVTEAAAGVGLEFHLDRAVRANTGEAHRLSSAVLAELGPARQATLQQRLMQAYFTDGDDVGEPDVLVRCAVDAGVPEETARRIVGSDEGSSDLLDGLWRTDQYGITSVPTYVFNGAFSLPGAQDPAVFERALRRVAERGVGA